MRVFVFPFEVKVLFFVSSEIGVKIFPIDRDEKMITHMRILKILQSSFLKIADFSSSGGYFSHPKIIITPKWNIKYMVMFSRDIDEKCWYNLRGCIQVNQIFHAKSNSCLDLWKTSFDKIQD